MIYEIIVSEVYEWSGYEYPSHSYTNMAEIVSSNGTMTAAQLMNQLDEVGSIINNLDLMLAYKVLSGPKNVWFFNTLC